MNLSIDTARKILIEEATRSEQMAPDPEWEQRIEHLSKLCAEGVSSTHIAFLGTSILAKAVNASVDLFAIKPKHAPGNSRAYSARTLCHSVLVPLAAELGISLAVTGREPLNNQPYFRMTRLDDGTPVHAGGRAAFDYMVRLVRDLQGIRSENEIRGALRAFIRVRHRYQPRYDTGEGTVAVTPQTLTSCIARLVSDNSEGGKRAQAVVAGMFDVVFGSSRVESGRINDPSRKYPGDVCIRSMDGSWEKAVEVRDKPVAVSDIFIFGKKCVDMGVREAAVVMVSPAQQPLDDDAIFAWAVRFGIGMTLFYGWPSFVDQTLFWALAPKPAAAISAVECIETRLIAVEASPGAVKLWQSLTRGDRN
jgi:hypothetical protein